MALQLATATRHPGSQALYRFPASPRLAGRTGLSRRQPAPRTPNRLRIIGGRWRGRKLDFPPIDGLRPTPDRVRETLFNWLQDEIQGARCLDLFAGSGALGLEALSRGAAEVLFCDSHPQVTRQIQHHLSVLESTAGQVRPQAVIDLLNNGPGARRYDIAFLDPPFGQDLLMPCLQALETQGWLADSAWIYLESEAQWAPMALPPGWQLHREKTAGQVAYRLIHRSVAGQ